MYARKVNRLDELHGVVDPRLIEVLRDILGQSATVLRHDGPVIMGAPAGGKYGDNELLEGSDFRFGGRALGTVRWGEATGPSEIRTNARTGKEITWVEVQERDNQYGEYLQGAANKSLCGKWGCPNTGGVKIDVVLAIGGDSNVQAEAGDIIPFAYGVDATGLAVGAMPGSREKVRWALAVRGWEWVTGYSEQVGQVEAQETDDIFGAGAAGDVATYYLRATSGGDPNVQPGDVFGWVLDKNGLRIAVTDYLDAKIGYLAMLKPGTAIKRGWGLYVGLVGRFPVGCGGSHPEYNTPGAVGGSHPIRPAPHQSSDPSSPTVIWKHDYTGDWYRPAWILSDHPSVVSSTDETGLTVLSTTLTTAPSFHPAGTTEPETVWIKDTTIDDLVIPPHTDQIYPPNPDTVVLRWVDAVGGVWAITNEEGFGETELTTVATHGSHSHAVNVGFGGYSVDLAHYPRNFTHNHDSTPHAHEIKDTVGHSHDVYPRDHGHEVYDPGHNHSVSGGTHEGSFYHKTEDYRPPWMAIQYIVRLGPDED